MTEQNNKEELPLGQVLSYILSDEGLCDVTLQGTDGVKVPANRTILSARSKVFRKMVLGEFVEATSPIVCLGFEGIVLKSIVEYVHTDSAHLLKPTKKRKHREGDGEQHSSNSSTHIPILISLASAAAYFNLPGLLEKVQDTLHRLIEEDLILSFELLGACREGGPSVPEVLEAVAWTHIRKSRGYVNASAVGGLSASVLEEILKDDKMEMTEADLFNFLRLWTEANPKERKSTAKRLMEQCISLENIDPICLSTVVASSGLATTNQLCEAYKQQAISAHEKRPDKFNMFRFRECPIWRNSKCEYAGGPTLGRKHKLDLIDCAPMESGVHQWKMKLVRENHDESIRFGIVEATISMLIPDDYSEETGWAVSEMGSLFYTDRHRPVSDDTLRQLPVGKMVTLTLNLLPNAEGNGTLTWHVEGGEEEIAYSNLLDHLRRHPQGFVPFVATPDYASVRLLSMEQIAKGGA